MRSIVASAILASSILAGLVASNTSAQSAPIYQEQNGQVVVEIEAQPASTGWTVSKAIAGYTGTSYYVWDGGQQRSGGSGVLTYQVDIKSAGNYQFNWRSRITAGASTTDGNDSFVSLSGAPIAGQHTIGTNVWTKVYFNQLNTWSWNTATKDFDPQPIRQFFTAGQHTIRISGRSPGHGIDRFVLFKYEEKPYESAFRPASSSQAATMTALPQSPTTTTTTSTTTSTTTTTTTAPPSPSTSIACVRAGAPSTTTGLMTTGTAFTNGADKDPSLNNLTSPLLFAKSTTNGGTDAATFKISLPSAGTWYLWGRFYYPGAPGSNDANSFRARIGSGAFQTFGNKLDRFRQWHWDGSGPETGAVSGLNLGAQTAGVKTITVRNREVLPVPPRLDVICATMNATTPPSDPAVLIALGSG